MNVKSLHTIANVWPCDFHASKEVCSNMDVAEMFDETKKWSQRDHLKENKEDL